MKRNDSMLMRQLSNFAVSPTTRIMEIGCGNGELTRQLSNLVGPEGSIIALDNNQEALEKAKEQAATFEYKNVQYVECDINCFPINLGLIEESSFDFLIGRRVLMYLAQPSGVIQELSRYLKKNGVAIFQESDPTVAPASICKMPAHDQATEWIRTMLGMEGVHMTMGFSLPETLMNSGLEFQKVYAEAVIQGQGEQYLLSDMILLLSNRLIDAGVATQAAINDLIDSLKDELHDKSKVYISDMSFCAWAKNSIDYEL